MTDEADNAAASAVSRSKYADSLDELIESMVEVELDALQVADKSALDAEYRNQLQRRVIAALRARDQQLDPKVLLTSALELWAERP